MIDFLGCFLFGLVLGLIYFIPRFAYEKRKNKKILKEKDDFIMHLKNQLKKEI
jgi:hypothetical protein